MYWLSAMALVCVYGTLMVVRLFVGSKAEDGKLSFKAPTLNAEESHGRFLPDNLKCDACYAIAHQFYSKFNEFNALHKHYNFMLPESELLDLTEKICTVETFRSYGVKTIDGTNRLTGPGLEGEEFPAMMAGGGKWPVRIAEMCATMVEIFGEEVIYRTFEKNRKDQMKLKNLLCHDGSSAIRACPALDSNRTEL